MGHDEKDQDVINYLIVKGVDPSDALRQAIQFYDKDLFALILDKGKTDAALLSDALQMTETAKKTEMAEALKAKGAKIISYEMDPSTLGEFVGKYSDGGSGDVELVVKDGKLAFGQMGVVMPVSKDAFRHAGQGMTIQFIRADGKVTSFKIPGRGGDTVFTRKESTK